MRKLSACFPFRQAGMAFDNRIPIHQVHSYCHCESMSHISGCATIRTAESDIQSAITGGWLPPRRRPAIGLTILPSSHSPSVISGISTAKPSQAMGAVMREPREGEIPVEPTAIGRLMISCAGGASRTSNLQITIMTGRGNAMFSPGLYL